MLPLDPLGLATTLFQAGEIAKKKEHKSDTSKIKSKPFSSALQTAQEQKEILENNDTAFLSEIEGKPFEEKLHYLVDSVYTAGDRLKKNPYTDEYKSYRKTLSHFLDFVVKNSYEIETQQRRRGQKRVVYTLVNVVNQRLDTLASDILFNQNDQLNILARIEEINGLLVDFFS